jgi:hypothetical protein
MALTRITSSVIKDATIQEGKFDKQYLDANQQDTATQPITFQSNVTIRSGPAGGNTYFSADPANNGSITMAAANSATSILNVLIGGVTLSDGDLLIGNERKINTPYLQLSDGTATLPSLYFDTTGTTGFYREDTPESLNITVGASQQVSFSPTEGVKFSNRNIKILTASEFDDILRFDLGTSTFRVGGTTPNLGFYVNDNEALNLKYTNSEYRVGVNKANPTTTLDVGGPVRADGYLNVQASDLPIITVEKGGTGLTGVGFPEQVLRVSPQGGALEYFTLNTGDLNNLASFNVSGDGTVYDITSRGTGTGGRLTLTLANAQTFITGQDIKVFGINTKDISQYDQNGAGTTIYSNWASSIDNSTSFISSQGGVGGGTRYTYYAALINFNTGVISSLKKLKHSSTGAPDYVTNFELDTFNEQRYNSVSIVRPNAQHGVLLYRYKSTIATVKDKEGNTLSGHDSQLNLIAILGQRDIGSSTTTLFTYNDYGPYNRVTWGDFNTDGSYNDNYNEIKTVRSTLPTTDIPSYGPYPGWAERKVYSVSNNTITVTEPTETLYDDTDLLLSYINNNRIQVCHDDTNALTSAIQSVVNKGLFSLFLTGGTYLVKRLVIPSNLSLYGSGKATIIKKQYFDTSYNRTPSPEYSRLYSALWLRDPWGGGTYGTFNRDDNGDEIIDNPNYSDSLSEKVHNVTLRDLVVSGNYSNQLRLGDSARPDANTLVYMEDSENCSLVNVDVRNSVGNGIDATSSKRLSLQNVSVFDNSITYSTFDNPLQATDAEVLKVSDSVFLSNPGPVDITTSQVVAFNSCIIRNSGTGLRIFGSRSANVNNNLILGPDDEWIPSSDIYDSDFNSVNLTCYKTTGAGTQGPVKFTYVEENIAKDLRNTTITPYVYQVTVDVNGNENLAASPLTYIPEGASAPISVLQISENYDIENGGVQIEIPASGTVPAPPGTALNAIPYRTNPNGIGLNYNYLVYYVVGSESVSVGAPDNYSISGVVEYDPVNQIYTVKLEDEFVPEFIVEDVVTLYEHSPTNGYSVPGEMTVVAIRFEQQSFVLDLFNSGFNAFNTANNATLIDAEGNLSIDPEATGYIKKKNTFTIAKGIIGVV